MSAATRPTRSLRRVLQQLAAIGLIPLAVLGAYGIWSAIASQQRDLQRTILELSRALASAVEAELEANVDALQVLSRSPLLAKGDVRAFYEFAKAEAATRPWWAGVNLVDAQGALLFKTSLPFGSAEARVTTPSEVQEALGHSRPAVGQLAPGQRNAWAFPVRIPVMVDGRTAYLLTAAVKPDRLLQVVQKQNVDPKWVISVFDRSLQRVARSKNHEATLGKRPTDNLQRFFAEHPEQSAAGVSVTIEGDDAYTGFTRLANGWIVAVGAPTSEVNAPLVRSLAWYVAGIVASVMLCLAVSWRLSQRIVKHMDALRAAAIRLGAGVHPEEQEVQASSGIIELEEIAGALATASKRLGEATAAMQDSLQQATAAGLAKDQFLALLGHELRNPLAPMVTTLHLMDLKGDGSTLQERQIMRRQVDHLRRLVDDLLDVSRIAAGKLQIVKRPLNVFSVIEQAAEAVQPLLKTHPTGLHVSLPAAAVWVHGDEVRLVQAVTNLLTNAVRFGGPGRLELSVVPADGEVTIRVRDEGEGMAPEALARIFEPFYQAPGGTKGGLGLGLSIVRSIVELHGGRVIAGSSGRGRGSTFEITLPVAAAETPLRTHAAGDDKAHVLGRVLIVDDNVDALSTLRAVFEVAGHDVRVAVSGERGLAAAREFAPEVIILDIGLPDMNGYDLARAMQALPGGCGSLIALTGYGQDTDRAAAAAAGFRLHFSKPADPTALLLAIEQLLIGERLS